ncbi:uncharacterized protein LOC141691425 [Apium graveolens]|uniref:uncharacterized protein LOC141691425 n=1 Tax=Apium graveolens TaxID=4045 RepID=UPI003D7AA084
MSQHRASRAFLVWKDQSMDPGFDLQSLDQVSWGGEFKISTVTVWHSLQTHVNEVDWGPAVWFKEGVIRYTHTNWLLFHDKLYTNTRLHSFGIIMDEQCGLCISGKVNSSPLFVDCPYSKFVLKAILSSIQFDGCLQGGFSWTQILVMAGQIEDEGKYIITLLFLQIFAYFLWPEQNSSLHDCGLQSPVLLVDGIKKEVVQACFCRLLFLAFGPRLFGKAFSL